MTTHQRIMGSTRSAFSGSMATSISVLMKYGATEEELKASVECMVLEWMSECRRVADELDAV